MSFQDATTPNSYSAKPAYDCYFWFRKESTSRDEIIRVKNSAKDSIMEWVLSVQSDLEIAEIISSIASELIENTYLHAVVPSECSVWIRYCDEQATIKSRNDSNPQQKKKLKQFTEILNNSDEVKLKDYSEKLIFPDESIKLGLLRLNADNSAKLEYADGDDEETVFLMVNLSF